MSINKFNSEGYYDPTTYEALTNIEKEERALRAFRERRNGVSLRVKFSAPLMITFPYDPSVFHDHSSHEGIRTCPAKSPFCKLNGPQHIIPVRHLFPSFPQTCLTGASRRFHRNFLLKKAL